MNIKKLIRKTKITQATAFEKDKIYLLEVDRSSKFGALKFAEIAHGVKKIFDNYGINTIVVPAHLITVTNITEDAHKDSEK